MPNALSQPTEKTHAVTSSSSRATSAADVEPRTTTGHRDRLVVLLALTSGATDAIGLLALGSAFTSVMTGNLVIAGAATAGRDLDLLALTVVAIGSFVAGAAIGARVAGSAGAGDPVWPRAVTIALTIELALLAAFAGAWWALGSAPPSWAHIPLLGVNALALGLQSSAIQRFGVSGLSTTYLTGTLTTVVIRLTQGRKFREVGHSLTILAGLVAGAAIAATLLKFAPALVPLSQLLTLGPVVLTATILARPRPS